MFMTKGKTSRKVTRWNRAAARGVSAELDFDADFGVSFSASSFSNPEQTSDLPLGYRAQHLRSSWMTA